MSYAVSAALQAAIFQKLSGDSALATLVGGNIFDAPPAGTPPLTYVSLGEERVSDRSDKTGAGAIHDLIISVITEEDGFQVAKTVAAVISDSLAQPLPALSRGVVVSLNFLRAQARRDSNGTLRRIDLKFRARVQDN